MKINRVMWRNLYKHYSPRSWPSVDLARHWRSYFQRDGSVCDTLCLIGWIYVLHGRQHRSKLPRLVVACCLLYKHEEVLLGDVVTCYCISVYLSDAGILKPKAIESNIVLQISIWYFKNSNRKIRRIYKGLYFYLYFVK